MNFIFLVVLFSSPQQTILTVQHQHMATKIHRCSATQTCHLVVYLVSALHCQWAYLHHQAIPLGVTYLLAGPHPFLLHLFLTVEMLCLKRSQQTTRWCQDLGVWILMRACWKVGVRYIAICLLKECVSWNAEFSPKASLSKSDQPITCETSTKLENQSQCSCSPVSSPNCMHCKHRSKFGFKDQIPWYFCFPFFSREEFLPSEQHSRVNGCHVCSDIILNNLLPEHHTARWWAN